MSQASGRTGVVASAFTPEASQDLSLTCRRVWTTTSVHRARLILPSLRPCLRAENIAMSELGPPTNIAPKCMLETLHIGFSASLSAKGHPSQDTLSEPMWLCGFALPKYNFVKLARGRPGSASQPSPIPLVAFRQAGGFAAGILSSCQAIGGGIAVCLSIAACPAGGCVAA